MRLLLETHLDPRIGIALMQLVPAIEVEAQQRWRGGVLRQASDDELLSAALEDGLIFVTRDVATIPALLSRRYERGIPSPGVILISAHSFRRDDVSGIARALATALQLTAEEEWAGRAIFLSNR